MPWRDGSRARSANPKQVAGRVSALSGALLRQRRKQARNVSGGFGWTEAVYCEFVGQDGYGRSERQTNYAALAAALFSFFKDCAQKNRDATIRLPYGLGCGLAGGDWNMVLTIISDAAKASNLNVEIWKLQK